jgi:two-component system, OmpR family, alkaline phosphatase synthesis response regulator PhoP
MAIARVLALDKDALQLDLLTFLLKQEGHVVLATTNPEVAFNILRSSIVNLVIVEPAIQRQDGHRICQRIRQRNPYTPLMIVSERQDEEQIIKSLLTAADDYVMKPFSPRVFLARVHALIRRASLTDGARRQGNSLSIAEITLNPQQMHAVVNGTAVALTPRELALLHTLMDHANRVLSRDQLMRLAWGEAFVGCAKTVDVCIQRLRKKLRPHLLGVSYIVSLRGFGYKFELPRPPEAAAG